MAKSGSILGAMLLVAGTCVGGGMLAFPVVTAEAGFFPSILLMLLGWAFMTLTALYLAEVNLWMEPGVHVISMASRLLGFWGRAVAWLLFLFISYASLVAYTTAGGELFTLFFQRFFDLSEGWSAALFVALFSFILYLGNLIIGRVNTLLMVGLIGTYLLLLFWGGQAIDVQNWQRMRWSGSFVAMPLLLSIFSFQTIIPSLTIYLAQDGKKLRSAIICGTTFALLIYLLWQAIVLGAVPWVGGLERSLAEGKPATYFLGSASGHPFLGLLGNGFAFFAIVTSFLGIGLGLFDFLSDGLKIKKVRFGAIFLVLLIALPTLFFSLYFDRIFLLALDTSGGIGDTILNALFPALMLFIGRYRRGYQSPHPIFGGKPLIFLVICYALFVFGLEILGKFGLVQGLGG